MCALALTGVPRKRLIKVPSNERIGNDDISSGMVGP